MSKEHDKRTILCSLETLSRPQGHLTPIWGIAEHTMMSPIAGQPVFPLSEISSAFCIARRGAWIKGELELRLQHLEECSGRRPFFGAGAEKCTSVVLDLENSQLMQVSAGVTGTYE
jgi:hypothetical protein